MSQTEIAGGKLTSDGEVPPRGRRLREFELMSSEGKPVRLSDYRGRSNLVVILTDERPEVQELLAALRSQCLGCAIRRSKLASVRTRKAHWFRYCHQRH